MNDADPQARQGNEIPPVGPLLSLVRAARRRLRLQRALEGAVSWALAGAVVAAAALLGHRLGLLEPWLLWRALAAGAVLPLGGAMLAAVRGLDQGRVARRIDRTHELHDRVGTALEFAGAPRLTPFMMAQVRDALDHAPRISPSRATPFRWPRRLRALAMALAMIAAVALLEPMGQALPPTTSPPAPLPGMVVDPDDLAAQRALVEVLRQDALEQDVAEAASLAQELAALLARLERRELTRKELFEKLSALERRFFDGLSGDFDELLRQLKKEGAELAKERPGKDAGKALQQKDLAGAGKELTALAERLKELDRAAQRRLGRRLERAARRRIPEDRSLARRARALEQERRRLQRKQADAPSDPALRRRLQRNRRQLERLNRESQRRQAQRRQLERLNRDLSRAAAGLRNQKLGQARNSMKQAGQQAGRMGKQVRRARLMKRAQGKVQDMKEMFRRSGKGKGKGKEGRMKDFYARAGGKDGKGKGKGKEGEGRGQGQEKILVEEGGAEGGVMVEGKGQGQGQGEQYGEVVGTADGHGLEAGGALKGEQTALKGKHRESLVRGKEGKGASRSEVILGAAEDGFSARDYKKVYSAYTAVVEDVLKREDVPLGYRYYVKRYFQLIRPR